MLYETYHIGCKHSRSDDSLEEAKQAMIRQFGDGIVCMPAGLCVIYHTGTEPRMNILGMTIPDFKGEPAAIISAADCYQILSADGKVYPVNFTSELRARTVLAELRKNFNHLFGEQHGSTS